MLHRQKKINKMAPIRRFLDAAEEPLRKWSPIEGLKQQSLLSIEQATKDLNQQFNGLDKWIKQAKQNQFDHIDNLNIDERAAIYLYTLEYTDSDENICIQLNRALRSGLPDTLRPWLSYLKLFIIALEKLAPFQGTVYRGVHGDFSGQYHDEYVWWGFSSCTETLSTLETFLNQTDVYTIFEIKCINGRSIRNYSFNELHNEVLLTPGACLRVIRRHSPEKRIHVVVLQEIPGSEQLLSVPQNLSSMDEPMIVNDCESKGQLCFNFFLNVADARIICLE